jgi:hypothetical protein
MKIQTAVRSITGALVGLGLIAGMSACAQSPQTDQTVPSAGTTSSAQASATPTASATQTAVPTDYGNEFNLDTSLVKIPADVTAVYGVDNLKTLIPDVLKTTSIAYNEIVALHEARGSGDDAILYESLRDRIIPESYASLVSGAISTDQAEQNKSGALVPTVDYDGTLLANGIKYAADPAKPLKWNLVDLPRISLETGKTVNDQYVDVDLTLALSFPVKGTDSIVSVTDVLRLNLSLAADGHWLVSGWHTSVIVPVAVSSSS